MAAINKLLIIFFVAIVLPQIIAAQNTYENFIESEPPTFLSYNSPLRQPDSLRNRPYYDFLSTLYRRDATKSSLFRPYQRTRRDVQSIPENVAIVPSDVATKPEVPAGYRQKRAIIFRPLFVYRQQQVRRQELAARRRRY